MDKYSDQKVVEVVEEQQKVDNGDVDLMTNNAISLLDPMIISKAPYESSEDDHCRGSLH